MCDYCRSVLSDLLLFLLKMIMKQYAFEPTFPLPGNLSFPGLRVCLYELFHFLLTFCYRMENAAVVRRIWQKDPSQDNVTLCRSNHHLKRRISFAIHHKRRVCHRRWMMALLPPMTDWQTPLTPTSHRSGGTSAKFWNWDSSATSTLYALVSSTAVYFCGAMRSPTPKGRKTTSTP